MRGSTRFALAGWVPVWYCQIVKIDDKTTQEELARVVDAGLRRDILRSTPLNLKQFIPFSVLFLLFPGMILGWRWGGVITAVFAAFLTGCLMWDADTLALHAVRVWFFWGCATIAIVSYQVLRAALVLAHRRRLPVAPKKGLGKGTAVPKDTPLSWSREKVAGEECYVSRFVLEAPVTGYYAFLRTVEDYDGIVRYSPNTAFEHMEGKTGLRVNDLVIYRLAAGRHELIWATGRADGSPPVATISQLNVVA